LEKNPNKTKAQPFVNRPKPASSGSATTPEVTALTLKEAGAAGSFFWLLFFDGQRKVTLSAAIPENVNPALQRYTTINFISLIKKSLTIAVRDFLLLNPYH